MENFSKEKELTVIIPFYNEEEKNITELHKVVKKNLSTITNLYEIILIDDGSTNKAWDSIIKICKKNNNTKGILLKKNYGQHPAIKSGIDHCNSKFTIVMDGDFQDNPDGIKELYKKIKKNYETVYAIRDNRKEKIQYLSKLFYSLLGFLSGLKFRGEANYCIFNKKILMKLKHFPFTAISFFSAIKFVSKKSTYIRIKRLQRKYGKTSYTFFGRVKLAYFTLIFFSKNLFNFINFFLIISLFILIYALIFHSSIFYIALSAPGQMNNSLKNYLLMTFILIIIKIFTYLKKKYLSKKKYYIIKKIIF